MQNNIESIISSLDEKKRQDAEIAKLSFSRVTLNDDEKNFIESLREGEKVVTVITTDEFGHCVEVNSENYIKEMEKNVMCIKTEGTNSTIKLLDPYELNESFSEMEDSNKFRSIGLEALNKLTDKPITEDIFDELGYKLSSIISERFKDMDISDALNRLRRYPLKSITEMMPKEFLDIFYKEDESDDTAKEQLLAAINYLIMSGPEIDKFQEYVSYEHHKINIVKDLMERGMEIHKLITSPDSIANIHKEYIKNLSGSPKLPILQNFRNSNSIETFCSESSIIYGKLAEGYRALLDDPRYCDDEYAKECILEEVELNEIKSKFYNQLPSLSEFADKLDSFLEERKGKRDLNIKQLSKIAKKVIKRIEYSSLDIPFPGYYPGIKNDPDVIYHAYIDWFCSERTGAFPLYNIAVDKIHSNKLGTFIKADPDNYEIMAALILIVIWRICKKFTKNNSPIIHRLYIESYFKMVCMLKADIFVMDRLVNVFQSKII